jgi:hypothetical protein
MISFGTFASSASGPFSSRATDTMFGSARNRSSTAD